MANRSTVLALAWLAGCSGAEAGRVVDAATSATDAAPSDGLVDAAADVAVDVPSPVLAAAPSTHGTEFWIGFMENLSLASNGPPTFAFFVSAETATIGHVEIPQTGFSQAFAVPAGEVVKVTLPSGILYPQVDETPTHFGVRITADAPIDVVAVHYRVYFSEATRVLPTPELGDRYVVVTAADEQAANPTELVVVATEDDTQLEVTPSVPTTGFLPAGTPQNFTLARGESIQFQAGGDLSGTLVRAVGGERIAVFAGARQAHIACIGADSHLWDEMLPVARWGTSYLVMPLAEEGATPIKVVADRFKTLVSASCQDSVVVSPGNGKLLAVAKPTLLSANQPIGVAAFTKSMACMTGGTGDPNFMVVMPLGLTAHALTWNAIGDLETFANADHWISLVLPAADLAHVQLDGAALSGNAALLPVEGAPELVAGALAVAPGPHHLIGADGARFQALVYGLASYDAYTFSSGFDCSDCLPLTTATPPSGCDPGDLRLAIPGPGNPGDPGHDTCTSACECYDRGGDPTADCPGRDAIWTCADICKATCGDKCEACPSRFTSGPDGRCQ